LAVINFETYKKITDLSGYVSPEQIFEIFVTVIDRLEDKERIALIELLRDRFLVSKFEEGEL
jgi:hypothetical protein